MNSVKNIRFLLERAEQVGADHFGTIAELVIGLDRGNFDSKGWSGEMGNGETLRSLKVTVLGDGLKPIRTVEIQMAGQCRHMQAHMGPSSIVGMGMEEIAAALPELFKPEYWCGTPTLLVEVSENGKHKSTTLYEAPGAWAGEAEKIMNRLCRESVAA